MDKRIQKEFVTQYPDLLKAISVMCKYNCYKAYGYDIEYNLETAHEKAISVFHYYGDNKDIFAMGQKININRYQRVKRLGYRLTQYFSIIDIAKRGQLYFGTLTFSDKVLDKTTEKTRRRYVVRFLNDISISYVANIDFGKENEREHYHCIFLTENNIDFKSVLEKWQSILHDKDTTQIKFDKVIKNDLSKSKLSKYVTSE